MKCFTMFNEIKHCEIYWTLVANKGDVYDNRKNHQISNFNYLYKSQRDAGRNRFYCF